MLLSSYAAGNPYGSEFLPRKGLLGIWWQFFLGRGLRVLCHGSPWTFPWVFPSMLVAEDEHAGMLPVVFSSAKLHHNRKKLQIFVTRFFSIH
jgi:hypothetical protein